MPPSIGRIQSCLPPCDAGGEQLGRAISKGDEETCTHWRACGDLLLPRCEESGHADRQKIGARVHGRRHVDASVRSPGHLLPWSERLRLEYLPPVYPCGSCVRSSGIESRALHRPVKTKDEAEVVVSIIRFRRLRS